MNTTTIQVRTTKKLKANATAVAAEMGVSLSALIKGFLTKVTRTKSLTLKGKSSTK